MKKKYLILQFILVAVFASCTKDEIESEQPESLTALNSGFVVQNPDWYHYKYINFYDNWYLRSLALIEDNEVIGVYSTAVNRSDFNHVGYTWSKSWSSTDNEYIYRINLVYSIDVQNLDWGDQSSGNDDENYWWDYFSLGSDDEKDYFNGQSNINITASTTQLTYYIKESDINSVQGTGVACINGRCPE